MLDDAKTKISARIFTCALLLRIGAAIAVVICSTPKVDESGRVNVHSEWRVLMLGDLVWIGVSILLEGASIATHESRMKKLQAAAGAVENLARSSSRAMQKRKGSLFLDAMLELTKGCIILLSFFGNEMAKLAAENNMRKPAGPEATVIHAFRQRVGPRKRKAVPAVVPDRHEVSLAI